MNIFYKIAFAFLVFNLFLSKTKAHDKIEISLGAGIWELAHIGAHYNFNNKLQAGIKIGGFPTIPLSDLISITGDLEYYYGGVSKFSNQSPWYINTGINYLYDKIGVSISKSVFLNLRHGRTFNFSEHMGLKLETGLAIGLIYNRVSKNPEEYKFVEDDTADDLPMSPTLSFNLFYRL